jgi:DNA-binding NarL/FixJ family response regulator
MLDSDPQITVVIASDSPLFAEGLSALLGDVPDVEVIGKVHSLEALTRFLVDHAPDGLIISVRSLVITTEAIVTAVRAMRRLYPDMGIVVISDRVHQFALDLLRGGQSGAAFLADESLISIESVVDAVKETLVGQNALDETVLDSFIRSGEASDMDELTHGQLEILQLVARGLSNRAIADELHYSVKSIEKGITAIFLKLGPFGQGLSDRRVSAALVYLRTQSNPYGSDHEGAPAAMPVVFLDDSQLGGSPT